MGIKKLAEKIEDYNHRLDNGKSKPIKPNHVEKVLKKLNKKTADLNHEIKHTKNEDRKSRLLKKLDVANEQIERAEWLLEQIT